MNPLLQKILQIESESYDQTEMQNFLIGHADQEGLDAQQDEAGNIYITKGKAKTYPCVVAHMDTVHNIHGDGIVAVEVNGLVTGINPVTMEQTGIGGDDKCGIYAALFCLHNLKACKAVFFVDEEVGCNGSSDCVLEFFEDCRFVLQADRRGGGDWVSDISGALGSPEFQEAVAPIIARYGYKPCHGMMSDVMALRDSKVGISVANMSAGYHNPHQASEFINLKELDNVSDMMVALCRELVECYPFTYVAPARGWDWSQRSGGLNGPKSKTGVSDWFWEKKMKAEAKETSQSMFPDFGDTVVEIEQEYCQNCHSIYPPDDLVHVASDCFICRGCHREVYGRSK